MCLLQVPFNVIVMKLFYVPEKPWPCTVRKSIEIYLLYYKYKIGLCSLLI